VRDEPMAAPSSPPPPPPPPSPSSPSPSSVGPLHLHLPFRVIGAACKAMVLRVFRRQRHSSSSRGRKAQPTGSKGGQCGCELAVLVRQ
jgi:hypothetical protein